MLRTNQKPCLLIDTTAEKVVHRGSQKGCIEAARELGGPCEVVSLVQGLVHEVKKPSPPAKKTAPKKDAKPAKISGGRG